MYLAEIKLAFSAHFDLAYHSIWLFTTSKSADKGVKKTHLSTSGFILCITVQTRRLCFNTVFFVIVYINNCNIVCPFRKS